MERIIQTIIVIIDGVLDTNVALSTTVEDAGKGFEMLATSHPWEKTTSGFREKQTDEPWEKYVRSFREWQNSDACTYDPMDYEVHWLELKLTS